MLDVTVISGDETTVLISDTGSAIVAQQAEAARDAAAASAAAVASRTGLRVALLGDSITARNNNVSQTGSPRITASEACGFVSWANWRSDQRLAFDVEDNFGVAGNTTAQMLARVPSVLARSPDLVIVLGGTNDLGDALITPQQTIANLQAICTQLLAGGCNVILVGTTPRVNWQVSRTAAESRAAREWVNREMFIWCQGRGNIVFIDPDTPLTRRDGFNGTLPSNATATTVTLPATFADGSSASNVTDFYVGWQYRTGAGFAYGSDLRYVTAYNGGTRVATLEGAGWAGATPVSGGAFHLLSGAAPRANVLADNVHPSAFGAMLLGDQIAAFARTLIPATPFPAPSTADLYDATTNPRGNILPNGLMVAQGGRVDSPFTGVAPATWRMRAVTAPASTGTRTIGKAARTDGAPGEWAVITLSGLTGGTDQQSYQLNLNTSLNQIGVLNEGDTVQAEVEMELLNAANVVEVAFWAAWSEDGSVNQQLWAGRNNDFRSAGVSPFPTGDIGRLLMRTPRRVIGPVGSIVSTTTIQFNINIVLNEAAGTPASLTARIGRAWLRRV